MKNDNIATFLKYISIKDIYISNYQFIKGSLETKKKTINLAYRFSSPNIKIHINKDILIIILTLEFQLKENKNAQQNRDNSVKNNLPENDVFKLDLEYTIVFSLTPDSVISEKDIPEGFIKQYIQKMIHPYFRKEIAESLQKAGLPAITIPLYENIK